MDIIEKIPWDYKDCLMRQRELNSKCSSEYSEYVIFTEHPDVYTAGIHFNQESIISKDVEIIKVERGGALTYHGPGQLVVYFIINLKRRGINILDLIKKIQEATVESLSHFNINAEGRLHKETGVWVGNKKIASIGLAIKGDCTLHGIAINVSTDLGKFNKIKPCDFDPNIMTSISELTGREVSVIEFLPIFKESIMNKLR